MRVRIILCFVLLLIASKIDKSVKIDLGVMTITAYSPRVCETDDTPFITSIGERVHEFGCAVSRDLFEVLDYGDWIYIEDIGYRQINDTMHNRWEKRVDIFFFDTGQAIKFGKQEKQVWVLGLTKI